MKKVIRNGVFETNSSACHSVIIMTEEQNKKWERDNLYYYGGSRYYNPFKELPEDKQPKAGGFYTQDEVLEFYKLIGYEPHPEEYDEDDEDEGEDDYDPNDEFIKEMCDFAGYRSWHESEYLEYDDNYYTTPGGEKIVVECKYGYDG